MLTEYGPLFAACGAVIAAFLAYLASRKPKTLTDTEVDKLKTEIKKGQLDNEAAKALADIKRDRHITRLEKWGFEKVMPWSRRASAVIEEQNRALVELTARENIPYTPHVLEPLAAMPQIDDVDD
jgi:hypothetical protein